MSLYHAFVGPVLVLFVGPGSPPFGRVVRGGVVPPLNPPGDLELDMGVPASLCWHVQPGGTYAHFTAGVEVEGYLPLCRPVVGRRLPEDLVKA